MNWMLTKLAQMFLGKHVIAVIAWLHNSLDGKKSELAAGLLALIHVLKLAGLLPPEQADSLENILLAVLPVTLADRVSKIKKAVDDVAKKP